jgi:uncharacterized damage-inducible protein DinB
MMLGKAMLTTAAGYHHWATERILEGAGRLEEAAYRGAGANGGRGVHDTLFHMLRVDHVWRTVCERPGEPFTPLAPEDYPDLATIRVAWEREAEALFAILDRLSDDELAVVVEIRDWRGQASRIERWRTLFQMLLHGMQHRSELAQLLTEHGHSPGDIDFIIYTFSGPE